MRQFVSFRILRIVFKSPMVNRGGESSLDIADSDGWRSSYEATSKVLKITS